MGNLPFFHECECPCHSRSGMAHLTPCCRPMPVEPPVEAIQGEARAREVLVQSGMHEDADRATGLVPYAIAIRAMLAFQPEARAVPSGALPHQADREAIAREVEQARADERERCAALVDSHVPAEAGGPFSHTNSMRVVLIDAAKGIRALPAILALSPTPSAGRDGGGEVDMSLSAALLSNYTLATSLLPEPISLGEDVGFYTVGPQATTLPPATEKAER